MSVERVHTASSFEDRYGFCRAVRVGTRIEIAGTAPIPQDGSACPPAAFDQMLLCGRIALDAISMLGGSVSQVVRTRMFIVDAGDADEVGKAHGALFGAARPVATMVVVAALLDPAWRVELEVSAELGEGDVVATAR
jgi:enamine deaminase RidA (YjgF/YER057c/UK114 family)